MGSESFSRPRISLKTCNRVALSLSALPLACCARMVEFDPESKQIISRQFLARKSKVTRLLG